MNSLSSFISQSSQIISPRDASQPVPTIVHLGRAARPFGEVPAPLTAKIPRALLVGENPLGFSHLAKRLEERGFHCAFASSIQQALSLVRTHGFDLVLSPIRLRGASLRVLMDSFENAIVTLFYFYAVEDGCWWLPAIRQGKNCWGTSAFRPSEFAIALDAAIDEVLLASRTPEMSISA